MGTVTEVVTGVSIHEPRIPALAVTSVSCTYLFPWVAAVLC